MGKIFEEQTALRLNFDMSADITGYTAVVINVTEPDGTIATPWTATVDSQTLGTIYYDITATTELDQTGRYIFQPYVTFGGGTAALAESVTQYVYSPYT